MNREIQIKKEKIEAFTKTVEIKICPFCGQIPSLFDGYYTYQGQGSCENDVGIECQNCNVAISFNGYNGFEVEKKWLKAIAIWNKRIDK